MDHDGDHGTGETAMTEDDWITATSPQEMLLFLRNSGRASERRLRLFAAACVRRVWHLLVGGPAQDVVAVAERFADGLAGEQELLAGRDTVSEGGEDGSVWMANWAAYNTAHNAGPADGVIGTHAFAFRIGGALTAAVRSADFATRAVGQASGHGRADGPSVVSVRNSESAAQAALLRDIFGPLPFRPVTLPPSVRTWNEGIIPKLAEAAYELRSLPSGELDRHRLAVLADALEDVGADPLLLDHLRGPGPRVRGDWVIDMLTGRE